MTNSNNIVSDRNLRKIWREEIIFCKAKFQNSLEEEQLTPQIPILKELLFVFKEDQTTEINEGKHSICSTWVLKWRLNI